MTEVKNGSVDLLSRHMTGTSKRDEKTVEGFSDFKTMLKGSSQKKDNKSPESKKDGEEAAISQEAAAVAAAVMAEPQALDKESLETGADLMPGFVEAVGTEEVPVTPSGEDGSIRIMDSFRTLDQFRLQQLTESGAGAEALKEEVYAGQSEGLEEVSQSLFAEMNQLSEKTGEDESAVQNSVMAGPETSGSVKGEKGISQNGPSAETDENVINPAEKEQFRVPGKSDSEKKTSSEEEARNDSLGVGERPYQPTVLQESRPEKVDEVHVTVDAEAAEELESKLSDQILRQVQGGKEELDIQLEPYNLGKIRIKISYENDQISVSLMCTESKTLRLLSQSAGDLGAILESNLERSFQIQVDKQESDYLNQQQEQDKRQGQQEQHQGRQQDGNREDFIQKLRLGIFEMDGVGEEGVSYR